MNTLIDEVKIVEQSDDVDNAKSPLIGDLDGIKDEYYQEKGNDANLPSLPPESNMPNGDLYDDNYKSIQHLDSEDDSELVPTNDEYWEEDGNNPILMTNSSSNEKCIHSTSPKEISDFLTHKINSSPGFWDDVNIIDNESDNEADVATLPPEHPPHPSIILHDSINNLMGKYETICNKVNNDFQFWNDISNGEPDGNNDYACNDTVPNQADNNRLLRSHLDCSQIEVSIRETNTMNTLICEVNEEYSSWCTYRNEEYPVDSIPASTKLKASQ